MFFGKAFKNTAFMFINSSYNIIRNTRLSIPLALFII